MSGMRSYCSVSVIEALSLSSNCRDRSRSFGVKLSLDRRIFRSKLRRLKGNLPKVRLVTRGSRKSFTRQGS